MSWRQRATTEALVLSAVDSRDDVIVRLLSPELGLVPAVARHARRSKRRQLRAHLQPLTGVEVTVVTRAEQDLALVEGVMAREPFAVIKGDLARFALASTMVEVVLHLVPDHGHEPGLYELLVRALRHLERPVNRAQEELALLFEVRALTLAGALPELSALPGLSDATREVVAGWRAGRWRGLADAEERGRLTRVLDGLVEDQSGRPLKSRAFLSEMLRG